MTEIGRKSLHWFGCLIFGTGVMALVFHWSGTIEVVRDKLKRCAMGVQMDGAAMHKNQCGKPSVPGDVVDSLSNKLKI